MRVDHRLLRAGVFLVLLGVPAVLVQLGAVEPAALRVAPRLWPLILVAIGIGLVLRWTPFAALGGILVAGTLGLLAGTVIASGGSFLRGCVGSGEARGGAAGGVAEQRGSFDGDVALVRLAIDCGDLEVSTRAGRDWQVTTDRDRRRPATVRATETELTVRSNEGGRSLLDLGAVDRRARWDVALPTTPQLDLETTVNAAAARLQLGGARLGSVQVHVNAGNASLELSGATVDRIELSANAANLGVRLGPGANVIGEVDINAGNLALCLQPGTGLEIVARETLGSNDFAAHGLVRSGNTWRSTDFDTASSRVRMEVALNAGTATLDPEAGCDG
jgi:hypothetical protein